VFAEEEGRAEDPFGDGGPVDAGGGGYGDCAVQVDGVGVELFDAGGEEVD
jgi:hypothetical protein